MARKQDGGALLTTYSKGVCAKHQVATCSERRRSPLHGFNWWPRRSITREGSKGRRKEFEVAVLTGGAISGDMTRTTACQLERPSMPGRRNPAEERLPMTESGKWKGRASGSLDRSISLLMGVQQNAPGREGPGPMRNSVGPKLRQGEMRRHLSRCRSFDGGYIGRRKSEKASSLLGHLRPCDMERRLSRRPDRRAKRNGGAGRESTVKTFATHRNRWTGMFLADIKDDLETGRNKPI